MTLSQDPKVRSFLSELELIESENHRTVLEIRKIFFDNFADVQEKIMYGGIIFFNKTEMFSGIFVYKNHISVEFSRGSEMKDPEHRLEGKGKFRRHLKILSFGDISGKDVAYYIKQSVD